jgi:hypothetical protein
MIKAAANLKNSWYLPITTKSKPLIFETKTLLFKCRKVVKCFKISGSWLLALSYWLLALGCWLNNFNESKSSLIVNWKLILSKESSHHISYPCAKDGLGIIFLAVNLGEQFVLKSSCQNWFWI